jgi:hypothetical protein
MFGEYARLTAVALLVSTSFPISSFSKQGPVSDSAQPRVRSTIEVVSQDYCLSPYQDSDNPRLGSLEMLLNLRVENVSDHAVILCEKCIETGEEPTLSSVNSDGTVGETRNGGMIFDTFGYDRPGKYPDRPAKDYAIIKPGENLGLQYRAAILVTYSPSTIPRMVLNSGSYLLATSFRTWWGEKRDHSKALARKWRAYGELYTGILTPEPVPIRIDVPEKPAVCPLERGHVDTD